MKNRLFLSFAILTCLSIAYVAAWAQEDVATKEECVAKVTEVAERIKAEGFDAVAALIKPGGPYIWKSDGYVFCMDTKEGKFLAHPFLPPQAMNRPMIEMTDTNGKAFVKEMLEVANKDGKGWVSYMSRRQGYRETHLKESYILKVSNADVIVGAGYFPKQE
jgi:signal transduction histidine kinase